MVDPAVASALISGGSSVVGGLVDQYFNQKASDKSYKFQKKVLQNQVQWRVADAVKAGLHPLAALGMSPASGSSVMVGSSVGQGLAEAGQAIGRAAESYLSPEDKYASRVALLDLEQRQANVDLTRAHLAGAQKALLTQGATPGVASDLPTLPPGALYGSRDMDPNMNKRLQDRHGEMADVLTAPQSVLEVLSQPGNMADPRLAQQARSVIQHFMTYLDRGGSFNRRSPRRGSGGGGW